MEKPKHRNSVDFMVHGDYALFSDVLTRAGGEKCSYMIPTYEALKGILQSVYFKPTCFMILYILGRCMLSGQSTFCVEL